jgi:hypothetical protein
MTRSILLALAIGLGGGCATVSGSTTSTDGAYATMHSPPPAPQKEDMPKLEGKQVWVPGYYQPVAGAWVWHQGAVTEDKEGYKLMPPSYKQENGSYVFVPPRWRRADLADSSK